MAAVVERLADACIGAPGLREIVGEATADELLADDAGQAFNQSEAELNRLFQCLSKLQSPPGWRMRMFGMRSTEKG